MGGLGGKMEPEKSAPENQDTPTNEKLYGGKYKTPEELEQAYQEAERLKSQLAEENDRMSRYISLMDQPRPEGTNTGNEYTPPEDEIPEPVKKYIQATLDARETSYIRAQETERKFYEDNPDLVGHEDLVLLHATKVRSEPAGRRLTVQDAAKETARRVRTQIETIRRADRTVPHVEGGSSGERTTKRVAPEPEMTEEQRLKVYLQETRSHKNKQLGRG